MTLRESKSREIVRKRVRAERHRDAPKVFTLTKQERKEREDTRQFQHYMNRGMRE